MWVVIIELFSLESGVKSIEKRHTMPKRQSKFPPFDRHNSPVNEQLCVFTYFSLFAINLRVLSNVLLHVSTVSTRTR